MENKSNKSALRPISNSVKQRREFYYAQMWHREDLISLRSIGLFSMIHQMILKIIFIELGELQGEPMVLEGRCCFYMLMKLGS